MPRKLPPLKGNEKVWAELLPAANVREHGRHIYMFRNTQTNQILYTLSPRIHQRTLRQLPFIGKHSVPPRIRPDLWTAHCRIGPFPTAEQGTNALSKLHEFRSLHHTRWHETNPEWSHQPKKTLIRNIMDQRANATADLSAVLKIHERLGLAQAKKLRARRAKQSAYLKQRWSQIEESAKLGTSGGRIAELEQQIQDRKNGIASKNSPEPTITRLTNELAVLNKELKQLLWAQTIIKKRDEAQRSIDDAHSYQLRRHDQNIAELRLLKKHLEADTLSRSPPLKPRNPISDSLLPSALKSIAEPFTLRGIELHWADLYDAEYAREWPDAIVQSVLPSRAGKRTVDFISREEFIERKLEQQRKIQEQERVIRQFREREEAKRVVEKERRRVERVNAYNSRMGLPLVEARDVGTVPEVVVGKVRTKVQGLEVEEAGGVKGGVAEEKKGVGRFLPGWMLDIGNGFKRPNA